MEALEPRIADLRTQVGRGESSVRQLEELIAQMQGTVVSLDAQITREEEQSRVRDRNDPIPPLITSLRGRRNNAQSSVEALRLQLAAAGENLATTKADLETALRQQARTQRLE